MPRKSTILAVDDIPANLVAIEAVLDADFDLVFANSGAEALEILQSRTDIDVILMDLQMPGMDGFELTRRLKSDPATRGIVIVALTAYAMKGDEERARSAGCDDYVAKPIDTRTLPARIAGHLAAVTP